MIRFFVSGTSTGVGKTTICRALLLAASAHRRSPLGLKPIETGPEPVDAIALAAASAPPPTVPTPGFYRANEPVSPHAAHLRTGRAVPPLSTLAQAIGRAIQPAHDFVLAEGAGGLLVPLSPHATIADLAGALGWPVVLVAANRLGVLSDVLCTYESAARRSLDVRLVVLNRLQHDPDDVSVLDNAPILRSHLPVPVCEFAPDHMGADSLQRAGTALLNELEPSLHPLGAPL